MVEEEPLVEVDEDDGVVDVGLHEENAHEHSRQVDRMVEDLAARPGVDSAFREDREVVLVAAPDWDAEQLERWVTDWLEARIPELDRTRQAGTHRSLRGPSRERTSRPPVGS